jgi:outer membrane immunogenic protein
MTEDMRPGPGLRRASIVTVLNAALSLLIGSAAGAADFYTVPSPLGAYSWAGPYLGGTVGYEWGTVRNNPNQPSGFEGGFTAGYNWRQGAFVFGGETDINLSDANDTFAPWQFSNPWFGTLRGRVGYAVGNVLLFGTAGLAYGELRAQNPAASEYHDSVGFAAGAGVEVGLTPHWSAKAEWLYLDLTNQNFAVTGTSNGLEANLLRFGLNYRF